MAADLAVIDVIAFYLVKSTFQRDGILTKEPGNGAPFTIEDK
jgi:hypothetical protein